MSRGRHQEPRRSLWTQGPANDPDRSTPQYRRDLLRLGVPYTAVVLVGFALAWFDPAEADAALYLTGVLLGVGSVLIAVSHRQLWLAAPIGGLAAIVIVRASTDGLENGIGPLMLVPAIAVAVYGSRRALIATLGLIVAIFLAIMVWGGDEPELTSPWRQDGTLVLITVILSMAMQDLTSRMRRQRALADRKGVQMEALARMTRMVATSRDPRQALVDACASLAGAECAALLESEDGELALVAFDGLDAEALEADSRSPHSIERRVLEQGSRRLLSGIGQRGSAGEASGWLRSTEAMTVLWEPIQVDGDAHGVLVIGWIDVIVDLEMIDVPIDLIAAEATFAIERARATTALQRQATTDSLTGVANRRGWDAALRAALEEAEAADEPLCVVIMDLDHFKAFNDANGHLQGDELLKRATLAWQRALRRDDLLARYGGEEFAVILPSTPIDVAWSVVERLRAAMPDGETCSAGLAQWRPGEPPQALMQRADMALYRAKEQGRNRSERAE